MNEDEDTQGRHWRPDVVKALLDAELVVPLHDMVCELGGMSNLALADLRRLFSGLRSQGFFYRALQVAEEMEKRGGEQDANNIERLRSDYEVFAGRLTGTISSGPDSYEPQQGRVLLLAGSSLPHVDSSSTRHTHEFARMGNRIGVDIVVATQMSFGNTSAYDVDEFEGVNYYRIPGPPRVTIPFDEWMQHYTNRFASVVRKVRPAAIVACSDFVNGLVAEAVSKAYKIPFLYDVRGFWEDSWLERQREKYGWSEDQVPDRWGKPDVWTLRREREIQVIAGADGAIVPSHEILDELVAIGINRDRLAVVTDINRDSVVWSESLERINAVENGASILAALNYSTEDVRRLVGANERRPLGQIERYGGRGTADSIREDGWAYGSRPLLQILHPFDWVNACRDHRSQAFQLHAWNFMGPVLEGWDRKRDRGALNWCLDRAVDWASTFDEGDARGTMAWYDMAIGLRAPRLAYLVQEATYEGISDSDLDVLTRALIIHQRALFMPQAFNGKTNHGFYTAAGQLSFARRLGSIPGMEIIERQGHDRLRRVISTQFASDGGHLEHSPDYHRMLLSSFMGAMEDGLLTDPEVAHRVDEAAEVMGWLIRPDRTIVQIGDSPATVARTEDRAMSAPHTKFIVSSGREGHPNSSELLVLPVTGFAVVRSPQPKSVDDHLNAGYLTFMASFHSRTHKHCDDLSVTWFDGGSEILIDGGRFGYRDQLPSDSPLRDEGFFYGRPERQYVERVRAHNTAQADGLEHDRRRRAPYGSGITEGHEKEGKFFLAGRVDHGSWSHDRSISYSPNAWLLVQDNVRSEDGRPHDFSIWWNLPEELELTRVDEDLVCFRMSDDRELIVRSFQNGQLILPVKGQEEPLRGWRSIVDDAFTPAWSMGYEVTQEMEYSFTTMFALDRDIASLDTLNLAVDL